ncbi:MAG: hypothetical protein U0169_07150 [Polyangiaceae bacterium]
MLANVRVATPCEADWDAMAGDERVRFCGSCEKNVYNLSGMTAVEAEDLLRQTEGRVCVRFYQRDDGTVLTADCPVGVRKKRRRLALASVASVLAMVLSGCHAVDDVLEDAKVKVGLSHRMGEMVAPPHTVGVTTRPVSRPLMGAPPPMKVPSPTSMSTSAPTSSDTPPPPPAPSSKKPSIAL